MGAVLSGTPQPGIAGILLAGGRARRMGGGDKPLLEIAGRTLLAHCIARLAPQCRSGLVLSANGNEGRFASFGLPVVADEMPGSEGPLAGLLAAFECIAHHQPQTAYALSVPGDTPFLPHDLAVRLNETRCATGADVVVAASGGRAHHTVALWPTAIRSDLHQWLANADDRSVRGFASRYRVSSVEWTAEPFDPFFNINTPDDLDTAERLYRDRIRSGACE